MVIRKIKLSAKACVLTGRLHTTTAYRYAYGGQPVYMSDGVCHLSKTQNVGAEVDIELSGCQM